MAVGDIHTQFVSGAGTFNFQPAGTNEFLITSLNTGYRVRMNITTGAASAQIAHTVLTLNGGDSYSPINMQKIFLTNSQYLQWDSVGAGETSALTAIQTA